MNTTKPKRKRIVTLHCDILEMTRSMQSYDREPRDLFWVEKLQRLLEETGIDVAAFARLSETSPLCCSFTFEEGELKLKVCNMTKRASSPALFSLIKATIDERVQEDLAKRP